MVVECLKILPKLKLWVMVMKNHLQLTKLPMDELKTAAHTLLYQNADFKKLLTDLGANAPGASRGANGAAK